MQNIASFHERRSITAMQNQERTQDNIFYPSAPHFHSPLSHIPFPDPSVWFSLPLALIVRQGLRQRESFAGKEESPSPECDGCNGLRNQQPRRGSVSPFSLFLPFQSLPRSQTCNHFFDSFLPTIHFQDIQLFTHLWRVFRDRQLRKRHSANGLLLP